jgi:hypothetical protein
MINFISVPAVEVPSGCNIYPAIGFLIQNLSRNACFNWTIIKLTDRNGRAGQ